jgi:hypothetical protein
MVQPSSVTVSRRHPLGHIGVADGVTVNGRMREIGSSGNNSRSNVEPRDVIGPANRRKKVKARVCVEINHAPDQSSFLFP